MTGILEGASIMREEFSRTALLLGEEAMERLSRCTVALFGLGGVGGGAAEALARCGVGAFALFDSDTVSRSNLNRQLIATQSTIGMAKVEAAKDRILSINPAAKVSCFQTFYLPETADQFPLAGYDYIIDAIDTVTAKLELYRRAQEAGVPLLSCMGTGNKLEPAKLEISMLSKTTICPLAKTMRREVRRRGLSDVKVLSSKEDPLTPEEAEEPLPEGRRQIPGSVSFVPPVAGMMMAGEVIKDLIAGNAPPNA